MTQPTAASPVYPLLAHLRDAHLRRESAVIEAEAAGRSRRIWMRDGEILLPADSPLAGAVRELRASDDASRWGAVLDRLAESYLEQGGSRSVASRPFDGSAQLVGPLPTNALLRRAYALLARSSRAPEGLRPQPDERLVAEAAAREGRGGCPPCWTQEELWVLERLGKGRRFDALAAECPFHESTLLAVVAGLRALGLVHAPGQAPATPHDSGLLKLTELLRARIGASLRDRPLDLLDDALERRLAEISRRAPDLNHYELLGVGASADEAEIHAAFESLARVVHPSHAQRPGIRRSRAEIERLFERAVAAMRTLGDPALRVAYDASHGVSRGIDLDSNDRREEVAELARREFERARFEELNGDLHSALVLYEQAANLVPRAEYWLALARLQARNPSWSERALESYRRALELDPGATAEIRFAMGEVLERAGKVDEAVSYYQAAAADRLPCQEAREALKRLAASGHGTRSDGGALGRLFRRS